MRPMKYLTFLGIFNRGKNAEKLIIHSEETLLNLYAKAWHGDNFQVMEKFLFKGVAHKNSKWFPKTANHASVITSCYL